MAKDHNLNADRQHAAGTVKAMTNFWSEAREEKSETRLRGITRERGLSSTFCIESDDNTRCFLIPLHEMFRRHSDFIDGAAVKFTHVARPGSICIAEGIVFTS